ncbi:DUF258 hypothetical protein, partial [Helicosporidium sp. ATCC 50920]
VVGAQGAAAARVRWGDGEEEVRALAQLRPVPGAQQDRVRLLFGEAAGAEGELVGTDGGDGIIKVDNGDIKIWELANPCPSARLGSARRWNATARSTAGEAAATGQVMASYAGFMRVRVAPLPPYLSSASPASEDEEAEESRSDVGAGTAASFPRSRPPLLLCSVRGRLKLRGAKPITGDWVVVDGMREPAARTEAASPAPRNPTAVISHVFPRRSILEQPRMANASQVLVVLSLAAPALDLLSASRFLLKGVASGLPTRALLNKADLVDEHEAEEAAEKIRGWGHEALVVSARTGRGLDLLAAQLKRHVSVFAGPSGAGKSALVNGLIREIAPAIGDLRHVGLQSSAVAAPLFPDSSSLPPLQREGELSLHLQRGTHTTRTVSLLDFGADTFVADTPGFSQPWLSARAAELVQLFPEMQRVLRSRAAAGERCHFRNCQHLTEPGCMLREAGLERYEQYRCIHGELRALEKEGLRGGRERGTDAQEMSKQHVRLLRSRELQNRSKKE